MDYNVIVQDYPPVLPPAGGWIGRGERIGASETLVLPGIRGLPEHSERLQ